MKTCTTPNCNNKVFSKNLCVYHWKGVYGKPPIKSPIVKKIYTINKMSSKGKNLIKVYIKLRREYINEHPACELRILCAGAQVVEIHHVRGRGPYLNDVTTWKACCRKCHDFCHEHVEQAKALGFIKSRLEKA